MPPEQDLTAPAANLVARDDRRPGGWSDRYGEKHRWRRLDAFPSGITPPAKVRVYRRAGHFLLNWWDPGAKSNLSERVDGDLLAALVRARQIDDRVVGLRTAGVGKARRVGHADLVARFVADLGGRADAGEVDPKTVSRYDTALRHYLAFCDRPDVARDYPHAGRVDRQFRLGLAAFLAARSVSGNGRDGTTGRPMRGQAFVLDTVRAMFEWAADPDRGGLLPDGFRNPFLRSGGPRPFLKGDPLAGPDITLPMAINLVAACDPYQLRLFVPVLLFGLRAGEPCHLFIEYLRDGWPLVPCNPDLGVRTKGRRDKRFPLLPELQALWDSLQAGRERGLLYERRALAEGRESVPLQGWSLADLAGEYRRRCEGPGVRTAADRVRVRDMVFREAGGLTYDGLEGEFRRLTRTLGWPPAATPKDLRHLFATMMNNAGLPEEYRRYLMGHAPGRAAIAAYTHLDQLARHYADAVRREWRPLLDAVNRRWVEFGHRPEDDLLVADERATQTSPDAGPLTGA